MVEINKVDRKDADTDRVLDATFDLFIEQSATEKQADFSVVYTVATTSQAGLHGRDGTGPSALFETIRRRFRRPWGGRGRAFADAGHHSTTTPIAG